MTRRDLINRVAALLGGSVVGGAVFSLSGCSSGNMQVKQLFDDEQVALMDEIADTILPETNSPGAKAANVGRFMAVMVFDCYDEKNQQVFLNGLKQLNALSEQRFGQSFMKADAVHRIQLLKDLDMEQQEYQLTKSSDQPSHYFRMMKELSVLGYFNSKIGVTSALRYLPIPGRYDGAYPYKKGDKAWAT